MRIIGLTGPSGAGKGETGRVFAELGAWVIDCDAVYHDMLRRHEGLKAALAEAFPGSVQSSPDGGTVNRKELARQAFASPESLERLNKITHSYITIEINDMLTAATARGVETAVLDAPTLFESGAHRLCDTTVGVLADPAQRAGRVAARDALPEAALAARMEAQKPDAYYRARCGHIITNDGALSDLRRQAAALYTKLTEGKDTP